MGLDPVEQAFIQSLFALNAVTQAETVKLYNQCLEKARGRAKRKLENADLLQDRISRMNTQLALMDIQIKVIHSPWEEETYWGLCNTIEDEAARFATSFSKSELTLFYAVVDELREYNGEIKLTDAQNVPVDRGTTVADNGRAIQKLHQGQWLKIVRRPGSGTTVIFGPRALLELPHVRTFARQYAQSGPAVHSSQPKEDAELELDQEDQPEAQEDEQEGEEDEDQEGEEDEDQEGEEDEEEDDVVPVRSRKRRVVTRNVSLDLDDDSVEQDEDEEEITHTPSQSQRVRRSSRRQFR